MASLARVFALSLCALGLLAGALPAAEQRGEYWIQRGPSTGRDAQQDALANIPLAKLRPEVAAQVRDVTREASIYRRLPQQTIDCDGDMFLFCLRNPEVVVNIWEVMGVNGVALDRKGDYSYFGTDGEGTTSNIQLLYGTRETHLYLCQGQYDGPMWHRKLTGRAVLLMRTQYGTGKDGRSYVTNSLDVFLKIDNAGADLLARTLHPLFGSTVDTNFLETCNFVARLSKSSERNGPGVANLADRLTKCDENVRKKFADLGLAISKKAGGEESAAPVAAGKTASSTKSSAASTNASPTGTNSSVEAANQSPARRATDNSSTAAATLETPVPASPSMPARGLSLRR